MIDRKKALPESATVPLDYRDIPVLLVVFNRPAQTLAMIERLRDAGVRRVFVSSDAARGVDDDGRVAEVRDIVQTKLDWDCDVSLNFRKTNEGLRLGVTSAIDWFFSEVDEGIILEDDCLPGAGFFELCADLLPRYRNNPRIFQIAGDNTADVSISQDWSYCFVRYPHTWGWATWRRAWNLYDRNLNLWTEIKAEGLVDSLYPNPVERQIWEPIYDRLSLHGKPDTWDWQWAATLAMHDGLSAQPVVNLVSNIGFGEDATHTKKPGRRSNRPPATIGQIVHPKVLLRHLTAESQILNNTQLTLGPGGKSSRPKTLIRTIKENLGKILDAQFKH